MKTILIPTDFSGNSIKAIEFAFDFFNEKGNKFILCHVYNIPVGGQSSLLTLMDQLRIQAEKGLQEFKDIVENQFPNRKIELSTKIIQGDFSSQINVLAVDNKVDFIFMGAKGVSGLEEVLIGSNTARLLKKCKIPVFATPKNYEKSKIEQITFSYDGKMLTDHVIESIQYIAKKKELSIELLHIKKVDEAPIQNWAEVENKFNSKHISLFEVTAKNYEEGLKKGIENKNSLLVLIRRKKSFWEDLINDSDSQMAVKHFQLPILVLPEE